jgi:hypothetical protein
MNDDNTSRRKPGHYFGTEIDGKWWKRYSKNKLLARGKGTYWHDDTSFYFLRLLTKTPISIPIKDITDFRLGKWHGGKWGAGNPILKIIWHQDNRKLSSGFLVSEKKTEIDDLISILKKKSNGDS